MSAVHVFGILGFTVESLSGSLSQFELYFLCPTVSLSSTDHPLAL